MSPADVARFWSHVDVRGAAECWPWTGGTTKGYGQFSYGGRRGRTLTASRVAYELEHGPLGVLFARHTCDNPPCCNAAHLIAGDHPANMRDMAERERARATKLHAADVLDIRRRAAEGERRINLAAAYAVTPSNVSQIIRGRTWKHLEIAS